MSKAWFITSTSKGFGRIWTEAALERGGRVAATARDARSLDALVERYGDQILPLALDVTDKAAVDAAVKAAHERFGRLDVVVNNAGYGLFGALWVTKAALPILREQGSGHIIQVSSIGGVNAFPTLGLYHASKWGLEGFSQALAAEVPASGSTSRSSSRPATRPTGPARRRSRPTGCPPTTRSASSARG